MKKGVFSTFLTASMALTAISFAQTNTATLNLQHASPVAAPTYLGLGYVEGTVQVSTSTIEADFFSPEVKTIDFKDGQLPAGFKAMHTNTTLSKVASYYWDALTKLGFTVSLNALSNDSVSYNFKNGNARLLGAFTQSEGDVAVDLSWTSAELVATSN